MKVKIITNKTQSPVGIGQLALTIEPGQSEAVTHAAWASVTDHPVVSHWVKSGALDVEDGQADAETAAALEEAEPVAVTPPPPAIPTPGGKAK
jgi:hypothetical protein